jgi:hypothetical protein
LLPSVTLFREEGAGKTGCRLAPMARCAKNLHTQMRRRTTGGPENTRPSLRDGLTAYACSPRSRIPSGLRHLANWRCTKTRSGPDPSPQGLTVATTVRTTRFCRTHWRRPPARSRTSRGSSRPGPAFACTALPRPPHPDPRSLRRTIAPLLGPGCGKYAVIPNFGKVEYFYVEGLTGVGVFCPTGRD